MFTLLISLIVIFSALLIILILVQNPKGGGINGEFNPTGATVQSVNVEKAAGKTIPTAPAPKPMNK